MKTLKLLACLLVSMSTITGLSQASGTNGEGERALLTESNALSELNIDNATSSFVIEGTSSLHDWEMISDTFTGSIKMGKNKNAALDIKEINVKVGVETLKSGKKVMDKKSYDALKGDEYPSIKYQFKGIKDIKPTTANTYTATLNGTLSIAGVTKSVEILAEIHVKGSKIHIEGEKALKMSDFDVTPPKALLGTLKTGNDITIVFNLNYI